MKLEPLFHAILLYLVSVDTLFTQLKRGEEATDIDQMRTCLENVGEAIVQYMDENKLDYSPVFSALRGLVVHNHDIDTLQ